MAAYQGEDNSLTISTSTASGYTITPSKVFIGEKYDLYVDFQTSIGWADPVIRLFDGETYTDLSAIEALQYVYGYAYYWGENYDILVNAIENPQYATDYVEYKITKYLGMQAELSDYFEARPYQDRMPLASHGLKYTGQIYPYKTGRTRYDGL